MTVIRRAVILIVLIGVVLYSFRAARQEIQPYVQDPDQEAYARALGMSVEWVNTIGMRLRLMPSSLFTMGSPDDEFGRSPDEVRRTVRIPRPFYLGRTEVTQDQFIQVLGYNPSAYPGDSPGEHPVDSVTWERALLFCNRLSEMEGLPAVYTSDDEGRWVCHITREGYRLPTEAEWEFACRAGTADAFYTGPIEPAHTGRKNLTQAAWFMGNYQGTPQPVAQRQANAWGLYDMLGNLAEWCWDWYRNDVNPLDYDFLGPVAGDLRVVRGGSWDSDLKSTRCASRRGSKPVEAKKQIGFRVARTVNIEDTLEPAGRSPGQGP